MAAPRRNDPENPRPPGMDSTTAEMPMSDKNKQPHGYCERDCLDHGYQGMGRLDQVGSDKV